MKIKDNITEEELKLLLETSKLWKDIIKRSKIRVKDITEFIDWMKNEHK